MRGDKAAAGFQPPSSSHQRPLTLPRHVAPLSHGRFPSRCSKPDSVNGDLVYGGVLWRFSLSFFLSLPIRHGVNLGTSHANVCQYVSPHLTVCSLPGSPTNYPSIFSFSLSDYPSPSSSIDLSGAHLVSDST